MIDVQRLAHVEVDARTLSFEYGLLSTAREEEEREDGWRLLLMHVACDDMLWAEATGKQEAMVWLTTSNGATMVGRARMVVFVTAPDCLRLEGSSPLELVDQGQKGS
jgi:hypothetical protein